MENLIRQIFKLYITPRLYLGDEFVYNKNDYFFRRELLLSNFRNRHCDISVSKRNTDENTVLKYGIT